MPTFIEPDPNITLAAQLEEQAGPVVLINPFTVRPEEADQLLRAWADDAACFQRQPGFISAQLHRAIGGSCVFLNYAVRESVGHFRAAFERPEFRARLAAYPPSTVTAPHRFQRVHVPDICVGD
jgi:hypothetical protein